MKSLLVQGGTDAENGDYSSLREAAANNETLHRWSTLKSAAPGDQVWFYVPAPHSAVVASGVIKSKPRPDSAWGYVASVGAIQWLEQPVTLHELRQRFPAWKWSVAARGRTYLPDDVAAYLHARSSRRGGPRAKPTRDDTAEVEPEPEYLEGERSVVATERYERDPRARAACLEHFGKLCQVCRLDLTELYGSVGESLLHVHHLVPLSQIGRRYKVNPKKDLLPVCPNCHAAIHRTDPPADPAVLRRTVMRALAGRGRQG